MIRAKFGEEEQGWCSCAMREGHEVGLWKAIRSCWPLVYARSSFVVGNGRGFKF